MLTNSLLVVLALGAVLTSQNKNDPKGYIVYCPCMGRFGNQADHFLGSLAFAKALDRTLILPPWVEYHWPAPQSVQVPWDTYFSVAAVQPYHRAITMETFMETIAPSLWPPGQRAVFCHSPRSRNKQEPDCNAKEGNPFGPFWDTFNIDFDKSVFYEPLFYDIVNRNEVERWTTRYPSDEYPVLAFTGAPAEFPVQLPHIKLQRYLQWSDNILEKVNDFIQDRIGDENFIGIHLRIGSDFATACSHLDQSPLMFAAAQCVGYRMQHGKPTYDMCLQSDDVIARDLSKLLDETGIKVVFVATDSRDVMHRLRKRFSKIKFAKYEPANAHVDLAILGRADYFIGNCISTFTAFAKRERDVNNKPSKFWAFPQNEHDEL